MNCDEYGVELSKTVSKEIYDKECNCILLSGGIDTSFVASSYVNNYEKSLKTITIIYDKDSPDIEYTKYISDSLGLDGTIYRPSDEDISICEEFVLKAFKTIDPIEVVCDIPLCIGIKLAKEMGCKCIATGDGGDELFYGYDFLLNKDINYLNRWMENMLEKTEFSSQVMGKELGLNVIASLFTYDVKNFSLKIPLKCKISYYNGVKWGKLILRQYLNKRGLKRIAWRKKTPILYGSNFSRLLDIWRSSVTLDMAINYYNKYYIKFPSYPHVYLFDKLLQYGIEFPPKCIDDKLQCPICGRCMYKGFCSFCGSSILDENVVSHYSDELFNEFI